MCEQLVDFLKLPDGNLFIRRHRKLGVQDALRRILEQTDKGTEAQWSEVIAYWLENDWHWLSPSETGDLTDAIILSDEVWEDDEGDIVAIGRKYSNIDRYQIDNPLETIVRCGYVIFQGVGEHLHTPSSLA